MTTEVSFRPKSIRGNIYNTLREYKDPITEDELCKLLDKPITTRGLSIVTSQMINKGALINKSCDLSNNKVYQYKKEVIRQSPVPAVTVSIINVPVDKCYLLGQARAPRSLTSQDVADFFELTDEEANVLINKTAQKYKDKVKVQTTFKVL